MSLELVGIIAGPVVGGVIGLFTNYLAVKMLFRPYKALYIGRWHVPFTPGIVARRKEELAQLLGTSIVAKFFNSDDLVEVFTSDYLTRAFADKLTEAVTRKDVTLREALEGAMPRPLSLDKLKDELCVQIQGTMLRADLPELLAREGRKKSGGKYAALIDSAAQEIGVQIEDFILHEGREVIMPLLEEKLDELLDGTLEGLSQSVFSGREAIHAGFSRLYTGFMAQSVRYIVGTIDVGGMITEKVYSMSPKEIETLVCSVVNRELRYVVYLGGAIGAVIGVINSFL